MRQQTIPTGRRWGNDTKRGAVFAGTAAAFLVLTGALTACSADREERAGSSASSDASAVADGGQDAAVGTCLREKGHDVEDGDLTVPSGSDPEAFDRDLIACSRSAGAPVAEPLDGGDPEVAAHALTVARCMREAGFTEFPDALDDQARYEPPSRTSAYDTALQECHRAAGGAAVTK